MPTNYLENNRDIEDKYVTKEYALNTYSALFSQYISSTLYLCGDGGSGSLGDLTTTSKSSPVQTICKGNNWKQVSIGYNHSAGIKADGSLWLWGSNIFGQLGTNNTTGYSSPVQTVTTGKNWKQVSCGYRYTAAVKTDGTLWTWGENGFGKLGTNNTTGYSSPVQTVTTGTNWKQVASGTWNTFAVKYDGSLWGWGYNSVGQLGTNSTAATARSSPVQTVATGNDWKQVSCGGNHFAAIKTDGSLWACGYGYRGQLGNNVNWNYSSPVQTVTTGTNWKQVSCGDNFTVAIKSDGTLWTWGINDNGQLGNNSVVTQSSPVQTICQGTNWNQVSCGLTHMAAIKADGTLWLWGSNSAGQLGTNSIAVTSYSSPVQTVATGSDWKNVGCGTNRTGFILDPLEL